MAKSIEATGTYKVRDTGEEISYDFSYDVIDSIEDATESLSEDKVKSLIQRMIKVDANNIAREKARVENGHSTRQPLTEEQKAERKVSRQADRDILKVLKSKGLSIEDIKGL